MMETIPFFIFLCHSVLIGVQYSDRQNECSNMLYTVFYHIFFLKKRSTRRLI